MAEKEKDGESAETRVILDALPYADPPLPEDYEQYALGLIEKQMKQSLPPSTTSLPEIRFRSPLMQSEYDNQALSSSPSSRSPRFVASAFSHQLPTALPSDTASPEEWKQAVQQARISHEKERIRGILLQVEKDAMIGQQWKQHNEQLARTLELRQQALASQQQAVQDINLRRQQNQQQAGKRLQVLETQRHDLVKKQRQLRTAIADIEEELQMSASS